MTIYRNWKKIAMKIGLKVTRISHDIKAIEVLALLTRSVELRNVTVVCSMRLST